MVDGAPSSLACQGGRTLRKLTPRISDIALRFPFYEVEHVFRDCGGVEQFDVVKERVADELTCLGSAWTIGDVVVQPAVRIEHERLFGHELFSLFKTLFVVHIAKHFIVEVLEFSGVVRAYPQRFICVVNNVQAFFESA